MLSFQEITVSDPATIQYALALEFQSLDHLTVSRNGVDVPMSLNWVIHGASGSAELVLTGAFTRVIGDVIRVSRTTPLSLSDRPVVFQDASKLTAEDLNAAFLQTLYALQERTESPQGRSVVIPMTKGQFVYDTSPLPASAFYSDAQTKFHIETPEHLDFASVDPLADTFELPAGSYVIDAWASLNNLSGNQQDVVYEIHGLSTHTNGVYNAAEAVHISPNGSTMIRATLRCTLTAATTFSFRVLTPRFQEVRAMRGEIIVTKEA